MFGVLVIQDRVVSKKKNVIQERAGFDSIHIKLVYVSVISTEIKYYPSHREYAASA